MSVYPASATRMLIVATLLVPMLANVEAVMLGMVTCAQVKDII